MGSNNKFLIKVPFVSGHNEKHNGFAYYFVKDEKVIDKRLSWDCDEINFEIEFSVSWKIKKYYNSSIKGGYVMSKFNESPMKFKFNNDLLVFNTIFNSDTKDKCLHGKYKLKNGDYEKVILSEYREIDLISYIKENKTFRKLFLLYNTGIITSDETRKLFDEEDKKFVENAIKDIFTECGRKPTVPKK